MTRMALGVLLGITAVLSLASAGCETEILAADYDQTCKADADCVTVAVGDICKCSCQGAAINVKEKERYDEDRLTIACGVACSPCPAFADAICRQGTCSAE